MDLLSARKWAEELHERFIAPGSVVVDATMGNGGDTCRLARLVGPCGRVYAFDVQEEAVRRTRTRLEEENLLDRCNLLLDGHENMPRYVREPVDAVVFNLGWLPGAAKNVTTHVDTTLRALDASLALLKKNGVLTVCVYPGHEEGSRELDAVTAWSTRLNGKTTQSMMRKYLNQPPSTPVLFAVQRIAF